MMHVTDLTNKQLRDQNRSIETSKGRHVRLALRAVDTSSTKQHCFDTLALNVIMFVHQRTTSSLRFNFLYK